ncbi:MAG: Uncharacterised protein [Cyanobium sp. ARS6]|nr:MAG: Uncharacterised protein [Cyanobium sp. ARS6]
MSRQNLLKGLKIGFPQHLVNHLPGLIWTIQFECDRGKWLTTADGHISPTQRQQVLLKQLKLLFTGADPFAHRVQFIVGPLDFRIAVADVLAESPPFRLQSPSLFLQGLKCAAQLAGPCLGISQNFSGFDFIGTSFFELLAGLSLSFAASLQIRAAAAQTSLEIIEFKQTNAQLAAHQKHQSERKGADQTPREHSDHHCGLTWAKTEQAQPRFADP